MGRLPWLRRLWLCSDVDLVRGGGGGLWGLGMVILVFKACKRCACTSLEGPVSGAASPGSVASSTTGPTTSLSRPPSLKPFCKPCHWKIHYWSFFKRVVLLSLLCCHSFAFIVLFESRGKLYFQITPTFNVYLLHKLNYSLCTRVIF